jgi:hypothetical protein
MQNPYPNKTLEANPERRKLLRQALEAVKALPTNKLKVYTPELQKQAGIKK